MAMRIKIYIKYGGMFNDDDRQLSTPNYNNINSFFYSSTKYHHSIQEGGGAIKALYGPIFNEF
jgi:hypothetical protein